MATEPSRAEACQALRARLIRLAWLKAIDQHYTTLAADLGWPALIAPLPIGSIVEGLLRGR